MQCTPIGTYKGPLECVTSIVRKEGLRALYKGASPPAVGWAVTDAILLGSLVSCSHMHEVFLKALPNLAEAEVCQT